MSTSPGSDKSCRCCGEKLVRRPGERPSSFTRRVYCDVTCQRRHCMAKLRERYRQRGPRRLEDIPIDTPEWVDPVAVARALKNQEVGRPLSRAEAELVQKARSERYQRLKELMSA